MKSPRVLARRTLPVAIAVPVQLGLGLIWAHPITHRHRKAAQHPAPAIAQAVRVEKVA